MLCCAFLPAPASASLKPAMRSRAGPRGRPPGQQRDPAVAEPEQILGRRPRAAAMVDHHGVDLGRMVAVEQHDRNAQLPDLLAQLGVVLVAHRHDDGVDAALHEQAEQLDLALLALLGHRQEQRVAVAAQHVLGGADDAAVAGNRDVARRAGDRAGDAEPHALGDAVRLVAELLDRAQHATAHVLAHRLVAVEHARHGADRDLRGLGYVANGRAAGHRVSGGCAPLRRRPSRNQEERQNHQRRALPEPLGDHNDLAEEVACFHDGFGFAELGERERADRRLPDAAFRHIDHAARHILLGVAVGPADLRSRAARCSGCRSARRSPPSPRRSAACRAP